MESDQWKNCRQNYDIYRIDGIRGILPLKKNVQFRSIQDLFNPPYAVEHFLITFRKIKNLAIIIPIYRLTHPRGNSLKENLFILKLVRGMYNLLDVINYHAKYAFIKN